MAAKSRGVGHDDVVANRAVVSDVGVSHDEVVAADAGEASAFDGASVDGDELANDIVVADFETRGLALIADILWRQTYGGKRKELIMAPIFVGPSTATCEISSQDSPSSTFAPMVQYGPILQDG